MDNSNFNIDLSELEDTSGSIKSGDKLVGLVNSATIAKAKSGNDMLKLALNVVSEKGFGLTVWTQLMLKHASNQLKTKQWLFQAKKTLTLLLGHEPGMLDEAIQELVGTAVEFTVKVEVTQEWGTQYRLDKWLRPVPPQEVDALVAELNFDDDNAIDDGDIAY